jgi:hypothetical protein
MTKVFCISLIPPPQLTTPMILPSTEAMASAEATSHAARRFYFREVVGTPVGFCQKRHRHGPDGERAGPNQSDEIAPDKTG